LRRFGFPGFALCLGTLASLPAEAAPSSSISFAIVTGLPSRFPTEASTRALLDAIAQPRRASFIVFDGALRRASESCSDDVFNARRTLLDMSTLPVIVIPGDLDWVRCASKQAGGYDPVERLDLVRQIFYDGADSLGIQPMRVVRESEVGRFRPFRENMRWEIGGVLFVTLNVPGSNNHYLDAGGRNGEFEDRTIANAFWLDHAAEYAKRRKLKSIVVLIEGDPDFTRYERRERFAWLGFGRRQPRDGYLEFKRALVELARSFSGPVLLIHGNTAEPAGGTPGRTKGMLKSAEPARFRIDRPLRDDKGALVANFTRLQIMGNAPLPEWIEVHAEPTRWPVFRIDAHVLTDSVRYIAPAPPLVAPGLTGTTSNGTETPASTPRIQADGMNASTATAPAAGSEATALPATAPDSTARGTASPRPPSTLRSPDSPRNAVMP
jgi:hypothetical protein